MDTPRSTKRALPAALAVGALLLISAPAQASAGPLSTVVVIGPSAGAAVASHGGAVVQGLPLINAVVARVPRGRSLGPALRVVPDRAVTVAGGSSAADGTTQTIRSSLGLGPAGGSDGSGVTVAVVDTGIADVPDLAGRVQHVDVTGDGPGDGYGHGTFVAGLIAGTTTGVAPGAELLDVKVGHDDGSTSLIEVLEGLQVVADDPDVDVLNLSMASASPLPYQLDPLTLALEAIWRQGVLVVVPAGNDGDQGRGSITSPGVDPTLLTVGGLDTSAASGRRNDTVATWSSQGPAPQGVAKPDLVAAGAHLVSTAAPGSVVWNAHPDSRVGTGYLTGSGTSFSTAVVAGAAALLLSRYPGATPDRLKSALSSSASSVSGSRWSTGAGAVDVPAALQLLSHAMVRRHSPHPRPAPVWGSWFDGSTWSDWSASSWAANAWAANAWAANAWAARQWAARQWTTEAWS